MKRIQKFFENQAFGVCTSIGERLRIPVSGIRLTFIYMSFLTFGSPLLLYLLLYWVKDIRKHLRNRRNLLWYY